VVDIREVGPRDGLQAEQPLMVEERAQIVSWLLDAGVRHIEVCSFVSPKAVPAMAGAAELMAIVERRPGVTLTALVPNVKGASMALEADVDELTVTISASPAYNEKNVHMSIEESLAQVAEICRLAASVPVDAVVSCAFGSPYEGDIAPEDVARLGDRLLDAGAASLTYADTTGMGTPRRVGDLLESTGAAVGMHLHDTRGTALVDAYAAFQAGVRRFDTSIGGLGGSPFAADAAGNLATEDLVHLLDDLGEPSGVDLEQLLQAGARVASLVGHPLASKVAAAGPRTRRAG
jgi:hydroxymethylglutaryl-CoA lyase